MGTMGRVSSLSRATAQKRKQAMHRIPSLALCITLVQALSAVVPAHAQPGTVKSHQKISDIEGGWASERNIDAADNTAVPPDMTDLDDDGDTDERIPFDLDSNPRFVDDPEIPDTGNPGEVNPIVDMGAYEFQGQPNVTVLTFDDLGLPHGTIITDQYADQGVIFAPLNGQLELRIASDPIFPDEPQGLAEIPYFESVIVADFESGADSVGAWIDFGFVGNGVIIEAFDGPAATGNLLASATTTSEEFLGVSANGILSVRFMKVSGPSTSFLIDNFTFELSGEIALPLDIKPGSCPNPFNRGSSGVLPVALVGTVEFDPTEVDLSTLQLSRADGVGGSVAPNEGPPGPHSVFEDVATPFDGEGCECHDLGGDGIDDLSMKFKTRDLVDALELDELPGGAVVELVLSGSLLDGTPFVAGDCIVIVPPGDLGPISATVGSNVGDTFIEVTPLDLNIDSDGFTSFGRAYYPGTLLTVTAPPTSEGRRFVRWMVDGVLQEIGVRTIEVAVAEDTALQALYRGQRRLRPERPIESDEPLD